MNLTSYAEMLSRMTKDQLATELLLRRDALRKLDDLIATKDEERAFERDWVLTSGDHGLAVARLRLVERALERLR